MSARPPSVTAHKKKPVWWWVWMYGCSCPRRVRASSRKEAKAKYHANCCDDVEIHQAILYTHASRRKP